ncbi:hypothetical protein [Alkalibaculum bacchi]|jgi:hypothetical protein|uniref:hypothetical protein n=1 Tax=Alkalibaculum bacchi TaxID=645887 RepID=UPI0026EE55A8|nr:hypothetical protein [Alkalibaculum bacchi]
MGVKLIVKYIFLNAQFYTDYDRFNYPEIERKHLRPYAMVTIKLNGILLYRFVLK